MRKMVVTYGEVMLRLSTSNYERLIQSSEFRVSFAGSELNVAIDLSYWGDRARFLTILPCNQLAEKCILDVRKYGVDTNNILNKDGRLGVIYVENGAVYRGSKVIYDRTSSTIATTTLSESFFIDSFKDCNWFHISGISPAISEVSLSNCIVALKCANNSKMTVSIDLNFRKMLWKYGKNAEEVMPSLINNCNIVIGNEEDAILSLGIKSEKINVSTCILPIDAYKELAAKIFSMSSKCEIVAFTLRESVNANNNNWSAVMFTKDKMYTSRKYKITHIVDRVGAGDSFSAGLIYGIRNFNNLQDSLDFAVAASCLKHSIIEDYCIATKEEIINLMNGNESARICR